MDAVRDQLELFIHRPVNREGRARCARMQRLQRQRERLKTKLAEVETALGQLYSQPTAGKRARP